MTTIEATLASLRDEALKAVADATTPDALEQARIAFIGKKGRLKAVQKDLFATAATPDDKKAVGAAFNPLQAELEAAFAARKDALANVAPAETGPVFDYSRPGLQPVRGSLHPLNQTIRELVAIFRGMGYAIEDGPEIEDEFHSFDALNIPPGHLARDPRDNFTLSDGMNWFRSQTSTVQIRVMQKQKPPIRCIVPGRVYRPDTVDATHHFMFHQCEGLVVGEDITFADLKATINEFLQAYYAGQEFEWRLRPHFFPFTEPRAEVDVRMKSGDN
ncbi:MAG: phenylalanine--tRNA ligase subunit alpha, partial [Planctomycetota bacterium]